MNVPDGWQVATLGELGVQARPGFASGKHSRTEGGIQHLRPMNITRLGRLDLADAKYVEDTSDRRVALNDVIFNNTNSPALVGKTALITAEGAGLAYSNHMTRLRMPQEGELLPDYLALFLHHLWEKRYFESICSNHVNQASVGSRKLLETAVCLPEVSEQRRIVEMVEEHMAHLDAADASLASAERLLPVAARGAFEAFRHERGAAVDLSRVVTIANGQTPRGLADRLVEQLKDDYLAYYKVGDMNTGDGKFLTTSRTALSRSDAAELRLHVRPAGTLVLPKRGGAIATNKKRLLSSDAAYDLNTMGLIPEASLNPQYLWHWFQGIDLRKLSDGSNVPQINGPAIRSLRIPVPDLTTQVEIVAKCNDHREKIERGRTALRTANTRGAALRRAVLSAAFSGRLTSTTGPSDLLQESSA